MCQGDGGVDTPWLLRTRWNTECCAEGVVSACRYGAFGTLNPIRCAEGVVIPRYKAYMESSAAAESMLFEETTGIQQVKTNVANNDVFTISGVKVNDTQRKGIYVTNGKKVVVK